MFSYIARFFKSVYYGTLNLLFDYDKYKIREIKEYFAQPLKLEIKSNIPSSSTGKRYMTLGEMKNINLSGEHTVEIAREQKEFQLYHKSMFEKHSRELTRIYRGVSTLDFKEEFKDVFIFSTKQPLLKHTYFTDDVKAKKSSETLNVSLFNYSIRYNKNALSHDDDFNIRNIEIRPYILSDYRLT